MREMKKGEMYIKKRVLHKEASLVYRSKMFVSKA